MVIIMIMMTFFHYSGLNSPAIRLDDNKAADAAGGDGSVVGGYGAAMYKRCAKC
jgi:hypothetical protein